MARPKGYSVYTECTYQHAIMTIMCRPCCACDSTGHVSVLRHMHCTQTQVAAQLRALHKLPVTYTALDWHQLDKELGVENLIEAFWSQASALLPPQVGTLMECS